MAWPFDRLTTYIANQVPVIKAFDLNAIQDYIGHWIKGSKTVKKVQADATGNQAPTAGDGDVQASQYLSGKRVRAVGANQFTVALSAAWGTNPVVLKSGDDNHGLVQIAAGVNPGLAANPTVTITFGDGAWPAMPWAMVLLQKNSDGSVVPFDWSGPAQGFTDKLVVTYRGTPNAGENFLLNFLILG